ncbi:isochorismatase family protein [Streptomyces sp. NPDC091385]|uniref:isochorismatase family protein n=1 Tax=Streptomyces sp. NPDC091385 TaxID=3365997 RepID=UPI0037F4463A
MTTLSDRPHTAVLVIDVQNGVLDQSSDAGLPKDSKEWEYVPELERRADEPLIHKLYADSFDDTDLESVLADHQVGRLVLAGASTDFCIRSTLHGAIVRGYDTILVGDAHTTDDMTQYGAPTPDLVIAHTNLYWKSHRAPGREADVVETADITF